jgi:hypothetical protein
MDGNGMAQAVLLVRVTGTRAELDGTRLLDTRIQAVRELVESVIHALRRLHPCAAIRESKATGDTMSLLGRFGAALEQPPTARGRVYPLARAMWGFGG